MDLLPSNVYSNKSDKNYICFVLKKFYNIEKSNHNCCYILNACWPDFDLPQNFNRYFISFHTEYIHIDWLIRQAELIYPKQILLVSDYDITPHDIWPENISFARYITIHHQLDLASSIFGTAHIAQRPKYKISSLSMRVSQYKRFVTGYLLQHFDHDHMILSYHNQLSKSEDLHDFPLLHHLKDLNLDFEKTLVNINDEHDIVNISPIENTNWRIPAFTDALFNLTNESFNYSNTIKQGKPFTFPGPYLTDKTFKPLLAGRPFIPVGQSGTVKFLQEVGFETDFGVDLSYDNDIGDLTRIKGVFDAIDYISSKTLDDLYESSLQSVVYNNNHILNKDLDQMCQSLNKPGLDKIKTWHA